MKRTGGYPSGSPSIIDLPRGDSIPTSWFAQKHDCLHDMPRPDIVAKAIRSAIKPDGVWFIVDIDGAPTAAENIADPMKGMMFAASIATCLQSSASTPDGLALGTLGLPEPEMKKLVTEAGFTRFQRVEGLEHPVNAYYEVRV